MSKAAEKAVEESPPKPTLGESIRETVDSIVIAFVLAFLFRTFEAEAFVIPTGSMALTLMGDHKDLTCSQCKYPYRASASSESPNNNERDQRDFQNAQLAWQHGNTVISSVCPNCRYRMEYDPLVTKEPAPPSYKGDRILVTKYSYDFAEPKRWDVSVFKNPSQAKINYIKRVVGLPNEEVLIYRGDIYVRLPNETDFRIARKPHDKAVAMAQSVYDQDYVLPSIHERGWPQRWVSELSGAEALWKQSADLKSFQIDGRKPEDAWLRYQHYVPTSSDWAVLERQSLDPAERARLRPQLIADFCEYNTERVRNHKQDRDISCFGLHWVGDVMVECELEFLDPRDAAGEAVLEIVEGGRSYQCRINAASGDAVLSISGLDGYQPKAKAAMTGGGPHKVRFANVDDQLLLWVDDKPIMFEESTNFLSVAKLDAEDDKGDAVVLGFNGECKFKPLDNLIPTKQDVASPIGIAAKNAALNVKHLRILRDVYYIADSEFNERRNQLTTPESIPPVRDYRSDPFSQYVSEKAKQNLGADFAGQGVWSEKMLASFMSDMDFWPERFLESSYVSFRMAQDQFFVLGDNSPRSLDGRLWRAPENYVKRELLIGKALFVYWPHGWDTIPGTSVKVPNLPLIGGNYIPDFSRMRMIR
jgi:signal peptidase I